MKSVKFIVECLVEDINVSKGNKYEVYQEDERNYWIKENKHGASSFYPKHWFAKIVEEKKKLNIIEAMKMPIGTEFEVIIDGEKYNMKAKISKSKQNINEKELVWDNRAYVKVAITESILNAKFIPIQKSVSFNDVLNSDSKCKIEHWRITDLINDEDDGINFLWLQEYQNLDDIIHVIGEEFNTVACKEILKDGKWYLED